MLKCQFCGKGFSMMQALRIHILFQHPIEKADYRKARGAVPWHPPMLLPEDAIRLGRD